MMNEISTDFYQPLYLFSCFIQVYVFLKNSSKFGSNYSIISSFALLFLPIKNFFRVRLADSPVSGCGPSAMLYLLEKLRHQNFILLYIQYADVYIKFMR